MLKKQASRKIQGMAVSLSSMSRQQKEQVLTETISRHKKSKEVTYRSHHLFALEQPTFSGSVDERTVAHFFCLHFSKAFNTPQSLLLTAKLRRYELIGWATRWVTPG